ncbi:MAG: sugar phosphate isomerase/epimerase, partial [Oscillospiraceae bacterium]
MLGVSTACFYPLEVEKALQFICESGVKTTEIFFNSPSELNRDFLNSIKAAAENFGTNIKAIHPLSSFAEPYMLFSEYNRRFSDTRELYKKYYETAAMLDADYVIIHGDTRINGIEDNDYFERFFR